MESSRSTNDEPQRELRRAIDDDDLPAVERALRAGADPEALCADGWTPMCWAADLGREGCLARMLASAPGRGRDSAGMTPLMRAAAQGEFACVLVLLPSAEVGAVSGLRGLTAAQWARANGNVVCARRIEAAFVEWERREIASQASAAALAPAGKGPRL